MPRVGVDVALRVRKVNQVKIQCPRAVVVSWKVTVRTQHLTDLSADAQSRVEGVSRILRSSADAADDGELRSSACEFSTSTPSTRMEPVAVAVGGSSPVIAWAVIVLPEPVSPTSADLSAVHPQRDVPHRGPGAGEIDCQMVDIEGGVE